MMTPSKRKATKTSDRADGLPKTHLSDEERVKFRKKVKKMISMGKNYNDIIEFMVEQGYTENYAVQLYTELKSQMKKWYEDNSNDVLERQVNRLEQLIDDLYNNGDYKTLLTAMEQLSKIHNLYTQKIDITTNDFKISFE